MEFRDYVWWRGQLHSMLVRRGFHLTFGEDKPHGGQTEGSDRRHDFRLMKVLEKLEAGTEMLLSRPRQSG